MCSTYLAKVNFVKDDLIGMADAPETGDEGKNGGDEKSDAVLGLRDGALGLCTGLVQRLDDGVSCTGGGRGRPLRIVALANAALRGGSRRRHDGGCGRGGFDEGTARRWKRFVSPSLEAEKFWVPDVCELGIFDPSGAGRFTTEEGQIAPTEGTLWDWIGSNR